MTGMARLLANVPYYVHPQALVSPVLTSVEFNQAALTPSGIPRLLSKVLQVAAPNAVSDQPSS
jgi:hypothetical protein